MSENNTDSGISRVFDGHSGIDSSAPLSKVPRSPPPRPSSTSPAVNYARRGETSCNTELNEALDRFFAAINFKTEAESIRPKNVAKAKAAFETLIDEMGWDLVRYNFKALLAEKSGDKEFRDDGRTPNWYHEFRSVITDLDFLRSGLYDQGTLNRWGGIEAKLSADLRHDSGEDFGHGKTHIFAQLEKLLHQKYTTKHAKNEEHAAQLDEGLMIERHRAVAISEIVDMMTRKDPVYDAEKGGIKILPDGRKERKERFDGDMNAYFAQLYGHPFAGLGKQQDTVEGLSTRIIPKKFMSGMMADIKPKDTKTKRKRKTAPEKFSFDDNIRYADEKRRHYGRSSVDKMLARLYPDFTEAFYTLDSMAGVTLVLLETTNDYFSKDSKLNPRLANPISLERYTDQVKMNYIHSPTGFRADHIAVERMETIARACLEQAAQMKATGENKTAEGNRAYMKLHRMAEVLENAVYPAMMALIGDRRGSLLKYHDGMEYYQHIKPESHIIDTRPPTYDI